MPGGQPARVVVVGAGFAGLATVGTLARAGLRVTLVDRNVYSTFQPLLYQVATGGLPPGDVAYPARTFAHKHGVTFRRGELTGIDSRAQRAEFSDGGGAGYDYLILATGVSASHFGVRGADEHSVGLYTLADAIVLRDRVMAGLERLCAATSGGTLTVTIVGGGATGVELAGTLAELRNLGLAAAYPGIDPARVRVRLMEQASGLLGPFRPSLRRYALRQLVARGVDVRLNATIRELATDRIILADGTEVPTDITAWAAGVAAPAPVHGWGLPQGRGGRILVERDLRVRGQERIFAVGDIAVIEGHPLPQLAQPALQTGRHAAAQVRRLVAGQPTVPFTYHDKGIMATIGSRSAAVQLPHGVWFQGTPAWFTWLALHLITLLGNRNRISALVNLSWRYLTWQRGGGLIVGEAPPDPRPARQ